MPAGQSDTLLNDILGLWGLLIVLISKITGICVYTINCNCTGMTSSQLELCYILPINAAGTIVLSLVIMSSLGSNKGVTRSIYMKCNVSGQL